MMTGTKEIEMPKYEDFKVGDTWVCRDGKESLITLVRPRGFVHGPFLISSVRGSRSFSHIASGTVWTQQETGFDLMHKKPELDLTKPLRHIGDCRTFSAAEIENVPEQPVTRTVKQWAVVDRVDGTVITAWKTEEQAERNCSPDYTDAVVELTGEYTV
jgi:hypothetical protein